MTKRRWWPLGWVRVGTMRNVFDTPSHWWSDVGGVSVWRYRDKRWDAVLFKKVQNKRVWKDV